MTLRLSVLGPCTIIRENVAERPPPNSAAVLVTLVLARRTAVTVDEIVRAVWPDDAALVVDWGRSSTGGLTRLRGFVQTCISDLRRRLDPDHPGEQSTVLLTERGTVTAYRLVLDDDQVDLYQFEGEIQLARTEDDASAVRLLTDALARWTGRPFLDIEAFAFIATRREELADLYEWAGRELVRRHHALGQVTEARAALAPLLARSPGDAELLTLADQLRDIKPTVEPHNDQITARPTPTVPASGLAGSTPTEPASLARAAARLATAVRRQWEDEAATQRVFEPHALPVAWRAAPPDLVEDWPGIRTTAAEAPGGGDTTGWARGPDDLAGTTDELADVLVRRVPSHRLVVLGEFGSGKTILLVRLVLELLDRRAPDGPVPVLVPLSSWDPDGPDLRDWLVDRLDAEYPSLRGPADEKDVNMAESLLDARLLVLVFDGLDEMPVSRRGLAVTKINEAIRPGQWVVLASRTDEYGEIADPPKDAPAKLRGAAGIEVQPLTANAVADYLRRDAGSPTAAARWLPVLPYLGTDTPIGLALRTPLMIHLARTVFNPRPRTGPAPEPVELTDRTRFPTAAAIERHLLGAYIDAVYGERGGRARRWLTTLARHLQARDTADFAWWELRFAASRWVVPVLAGLVCGIGVALAVGLAGPLTAALGGQPDKVVGLGPGVGILLGFTVAMPLQRLTGRPVEPAPGVAGGLVGGLAGGFLAAAANLAGLGYATWPTGGLGSGLGVGAAIGPAAGIVGGLTGGLVGGAVAAMIGGYGTGGLSGVVNGVAVAVAVGLTSRVDEHRGPARNVRWSKAGLLSGLAAGLAVGLGAALLAGPAKAIVAGVVTASVIALAAGLTSGAADPTAAASVRTVLRRDAHAFAAYSAAAAVAGALVGGLTNGLDSIRVDNLATTMADLVANGFAVGLAAAIVASAMFGLLHAAWWPYTLTRAWLAAQGRLPWRLMGFLDEAHRRGALRQVGSYYQFRHIELQRELARDPQPRSG